MMVGRSVWSRVSRIRASLRDTGGENANLFGSQVIPESYRAGSDFFTSEKPKCQLALWVRDDTDRWTASQSAWRYQDFLVTTAHGCPNPEDFALSVNGNDPVRVGGNVVVNQDDVLVFKLPVKIWSQLGVSASTITTYTGGFVRVTGIEAHHSTSVGILDKTDVMAKYVYTGSTRPGHSGAPYVVGANQVVAMHVAGGTKNLAVSAQYIKSLIERRSVIPEARFHNDDWYDPNHEGPIEYTSRRSRYNPDEYEVEFGGEFHSMDEDNFRKFKRHAANTQRSYRPNHYTRDYYPECVERYTYGPTGLMRKAEFDPCPAGRYNMHRDHVECKDHIDVQAEIQPECTLKLKDVGLPLPKATLDPCALGSFNDPGKKCEIEIELLEKKKNSFLATANPASDMSGQPNHYAELLQQQAQILKSLNTLTMQLQSNLSNCSPSQTSPLKDQMS